ncbi:MAG: Maf family protein [Clostridia bacterium]|nr:Maf family protein [Clostridia bacterium]
MQKFSKRVVLASASPRRREILTDMGIEFEILPSDIDESRIKAASPRLLTKKLAVAKAEAVGVSGATVIGADTVVVLGGKVYGKPHTKDNAVRMLGELCGRWHTVYTGVCVTCDGEKISFTVRSKVKLKALGKEEITRYVDDANPLDKAGAYGIQDGRVVEKYRGSYTNIVGLPKEKLASVLARIGVTNGNC